MTYVLLAVIGAAMGSFVDAFTWRLHTRRDFIRGRSECESCHHPLAPQDLIPIVSWLALRGKCRYCKVRLTSLAPITEALMGALFVVSYIVWPFGFDSWQGIALFGLWLVYLVMLGALFRYDLKWMLLPDVIMTPLIFSAVIYAGLRVSLTPHATLTDYAFIAVDALVLTLIYWVLHTCSRGRWVGYGDVKLSLFMGLVLGWQYALLAFALANMLGVLLVVPGLLSGRLSRKSQIPFGPFLIAGTIVAGLWGKVIVGWYFASFGLPVEF